MSNQAYTNVDTRARLDKAASVFQRLRPNWSSHFISNTINFRLYSSTVLSTAQQASDTWKSTTSIRNIDVFHRRCIRRKIVAGQHCQRGNYEKSRDAWRVTNSENSQMRQAGHVLVDARKQDHKCSFELASKNQQKIKR